MQLDQMEMAAFEKMFQSSPAPEGECNVAYAYQSRHAISVSILTRP